MTTLTRAQANEILNLWRAGAAHYPAQTINLALWVTGDIE